MADKDPKSPATTSAAYDVMLPRWQLVEDLLGGTEAMRAAGERHLPRHPEETDEAYKNRLAVATLFNVFEETLGNLASKPFREPLQLNDDVPEALHPLLDNVDLQGNNLHVFALEWFRAAMGKAFFHVLIDAPRPKPKADGTPRTLDDDRKEGIRPYWVPIKPENVLFIDSEVIDGVEVLKHVRIQECYTERNGFTEVHKKRIRILEPGTVALWQPKPTTNASQKEEWYQVDAWETGLSYVPLLTFYPGERDGVALARSTLQGLADLNVTHWQSSSEQRHCLTVARFPILACSGASKDDSDPIVVGPNKVLYNDDAQGKFYYVEHTGAAIEAGRQDLLDLEEKMGSFGAEFLKDNPGNPTATAKAIDSSESNSALAQMVLKFEDMIAQALSITAAWIGAGDDGGTVELVKDFTPEEADAPGLDALKAARASRDVSRKAYLQGLVLRGVLPEDFDAEEDEAELQEEMDKIMSLGGTDVNLDPLGNPQLVPKKPGEDDNGDPTEGTGKPTPAAKKAPAKKPAAKAKPGAKK